MPTKRKYCKFGKTSILPLPRLSVLVLLGSKTQFLVSCMYYLPFWMFKSRHIPIISINVILNEKSSLPSFGILLKVIFHFLKYAHISSPQIVKNVLWNCLQYKVNDVAHVPERITEVFWYTWAQINNRIFQQSTVEQIPKKLLVT